MARAEPDLCPMSSTPLSDVIDVVRERGNEENYNRFLEAFLRARLGIIAHGLPPGISGIVRSGPDTSCASVEHPARRGAFVLACADMAMFNTRFARKFNAELDAHSLMNIVVANPSSAGILINSAKSEHSIVIERTTIERLLEPSPTNARNPWWKFW